MAQWPNFDICRRVIYRRLTRPAVMQPANIPGVGVAVVSPPIRKLPLGSFRGVHRKPRTDRQQPDFALHRCKINPFSLQIISPEWRTIDTGKIQGQEDPGHPRSLAEGYPRVKK